MKYRIKERPTGYISLGGAGLQEWPKVGEVVDLPGSQAESMIAAGVLEVVADEKPAVEPEPVVETRPAPTADVETRAPAKKATPRKRAPSRKD